LIFDILSGTNRSLDLGGSTSELYTFGSSLQIDSEGKKLLTSVLRNRSDIWMLTGFPQPRSDFFPFLSKLLHLN